MKYLAHRQKDGSDKPISIYDVIKGRKSVNVESWGEGITYYSLWYYTPMKAVVNVTQKRPHSAFINGSDPGHQDGGESLEHSLSKKILSEIKVLKVCVYKKNYEIPIREGQIEHPAQFLDRKYRIDVMLQAEPCEFTNKFGSTRIGVETKKSSKVKSVKKQALRNVSEMVLLEISLWDKITLTEDYDVEKLNNALEHYWQKERMAFCLHAPNYKVLYAEHTEGERREEQQKFQLIKDIEPIKPITPQPIKVAPLVQELELPKQGKRKFNLKILILGIAFILILLYYLFR